MLFGPFTANVIKALELKLHALGVEYLVEQDKEQLAELEAEFKRKAKENPRRGPEGYDPAFLFLDIEEKWFESKGPELAELGFTLGDEAPDFSVQDMVCPECGKLERCDTHKLPLVPWSQYIESQRSKGYNGFSTGQIALLLGVVLLGYLLWAFLAV